MAIGAWGQASIHPSDPPFWFAFGCCDNHANPREVLQSCGGVWGDSFGSAVERRRTIVPLRQISRLLGSCGGAGWLLCVRLDVVEVQDRVEQQVELTKILPPVTGVPREHDHASLSRRLVDD